MPLFLHSQEEENHLNFPLDESCDCDGCCPNGHCDCLGCDEPCDCEDEDVPTLGHELSDVEADADTLASAGWGTDEDYGYYGGGE